MRLHAKHDSNPSISDAAIDRIIGFSGEIGYVDLLIDGLMKNEGNSEQRDWIAGYIRKLADFGRKIDPALWENDTRKNNLEIVKKWMDSLYEATFFDNNILVGMYKYKGDRAEEKYDGAEPAKEHFRNAVQYYEKGHARANTAKAKVELHHALSFLHSRYKSKNKAELIRKYKKGFDHAKIGLDLVKNEIQKGKSKNYPYEKKNKALLHEIQMHYANNFVGYIYNLYLTKEYKTIVDNHEHATGVPPSTGNLTDAFLLIAESAKELSLKYPKGSPKRERCKEIFQKMKNLALGAFIEKEKNTPPY